MNSHIKITGEAELSRGLVRFKMDVSNETPATITDVALELFFKEAILRINRHEPPAYPRQNSRVLLGTIRGGEMKTLAVYFDRLVAFNCTELSCNVDYKNADGTSGFAFMGTQDISFPSESSNERTVINFNIRDSVVQKCNFFNQCAVSGNSSESTALENSVVRSSGSESEKENEEEKRDGEARQEKNKEEKPMAHIGGAGKTATFNGIEFVQIPAGEFMMGSPSKEEGRREDEGPVHKVVIKRPFYLGKYPVTQKQWIELMGSNPSHFKGDFRPVDSVSWNEVQKFIKKLNKMEKIDKYRLPSEAEWEYACRAGTDTRYSFGNDESEVGKYTWYGKNAEKKTHPVGQKKPNPWGLYDMHGNVWERVQDPRHKNYEGAPSDGSVWENGGIYTRIERGGSWYDASRLCRSSFRASNSPKKQSNNLGFRLLREV